MQTLHHQISWKCTKNFVNNIFVMTMWLQKLQNFQIWSHEVYYYYRLTDFLTYYSCM